MSDSDSSDCSSSYDESESSSERAWTCDDIYPTKAEKASGGADSSSDDDSSDYDTDSSASFAAAPPAKNTAKTVDSSESSDDDSEAKLARKALPKRSASAERRGLNRHSSADIEAIITTQEDVLAKAKAEEKKREALLNKNRESLRQRSEEALNISKHLEQELDNMSSEFDSSEHALKQLEKKVDEKRRSSTSRNSKTRKEQKDKFERKNLEREMRLAKARERIEKKKEEEAKKQEQKLMDEKNNAGKLDMSKAARVERAYSWYTRMAMPTREKMKERVEFMPASSGVTPDDVDLLPWNARGTFVSVAAMMKMNRTAASSGRKKKSDDSDSDSDSD